MLNIVIAETPKGFRGLVMDATEIVYCTAQYCTEQTAMFIATRVADWQQNPQRLTGSPINSKAPTTEDKMPTDPVAFAEVWRAR